MLGQFMKSLPILEKIFEKNLKPLKLNLEAIILLIFNKFRQKSKS